MPIIYYFDKKNVRNTQPGVSFTLTLTYRPTDFEFLSNPSDIIPDLMKTRKRLTCCQNNTLCIVDTTA